MHRSLRGALPLLLPLLLLLPTSGCSVFWFLSLDRDEELIRGAIQGTVVRADEGNAAAAFAQVKLPGSARGVVADASGRFVVRDLLAGPWALRVVDDPDGDGWADRARVQGVFVPEVQHYASPIDQVAQNGTLATAGVDLGEVTLEKTGVIGGRVFAGTMGTPPDLQGLIGRVLITRDLDVEVDLFGETAAFELGAEVIEGVDSEGRWQATGVGGGEVKVIPLLYESVVGQPGALGPLVAVGEASTFLVTAAAGLDDAPEEVGDIVVPPPFDEVTTRASVALELGPGVAGDVYVMFVQAGAPLPPCETSCVPLQTCDPVIDGLYTSNYPTLRTTAAMAPSNTLNLQAPLGAWDLRVCSGEKSGSLRGQVLARPPSVDVIPRWGPVALGAEDTACLSFVASEGESCAIDSDCTEGGRCLPTGERAGFLGLGGVELLCHVPLADDCDGDFLSGLPAFELPLVGLFDDCAAACGDLRGAELDGATCDVGGEIYDCDDDGDGQVDGLERQCYGRSGDDPGTDRDGDRVCSSLDPYPLCAANDPVACEAGTNDARGEGGEPRDGDGGGTFIPQPELTLEFDGLLSGGTPIFEANAFYDGVYEPSLGVSFIVGQLVGGDVAVWSVSDEGSVATPVILAGLPGAFGTSVTLRVDEVDGRELIVGGASPDPMGPDLATLWRIAVSASPPYLSAPDPSATNLAPVDAPIDTVAGDWLHRSSAVLSAVSATLDGVPSALTCGAGNFTELIDGVPTAASFLWAHPTPSPWMDDPPQGFGRTAAGVTLDEATVLGAASACRDLATASSAGVVVGAGSVVDGELLRGAVAVSGLALGDYLAGLLLPGAEGTSTSELEGIAVRDDGGEPRILAVGRRDDLPFSRPVMWPLSWRSPNILTEEEPPQELPLPAGASGGAAVDVVPRRGGSGWVVTGTVAYGDGPTDMIAWLIADDWVPLGFVTDDLDGPGLALGEGTHRLVEAQNDQFLVVGEGAGGTVGVLWTLRVSAGTPGMDDGAPDAGSFQEPPIDAGVMPLPDAGADLPEPPPDGGGLGPGGG